MTIKKSVTKKAADRPSIKKLIAPKGKKITNMSASEFAITKNMDISSPK